MLLFRVLGLRQRHNRWHIRVLPSLADKLGIHLLVFVGLAVDRGFEVSLHNRRVPSEVWSATKLADYLLVIVSMDCFGGRCRSEQTGDGAVSFLVGLFRKR